MGEFYRKHENRDNVSKKTSLQKFDANLLFTDDRPKKLSSSDILHLHGTIEVQMYDGEEVDLHINYYDCKKYPGHPQFIPIKDFTMEHLPEGYHDTALYDLIKATAKLTVRVDVRITSHKRPEFWPDTDVPYPFYNCRGKVGFRRGSGVIYVYKFIHGQGYDGYGKRNDFVTGRIIERKYTTCPCDKCVDSDKPNNIWWEIYVVTATHVVFDEIEVSKTICILNYDNVGSNVVPLRKFSLDSVDKQADQCVMKHVTCEDIGKELYEINVHWCDLWSKVKIKYMNRSNVIFIVSHPHGCSKQISVGRLISNYKTEEFNENYDMTKLTYTTATCPGSSGAKVFYLGFGATHIHAGCISPGLNYSSVSYFWRK